MERGEDGTGKDTIGLALAAKMKGRTSLNPADVLVTTSGALLKTHKVKRIFHAAANVGQVGKGYSPIPDVARCVVNALNAVKDSPKDCGGCELSSILIPLMGTRPRRGNVQEDLVKSLLNAAIDHLTRNPDCTFRKVYFLTYTDQEFEICRSLLPADPRLKPPNPNPSVLGELAAEPR